jgi:hypothetical protein
MNISRNFRLKIIRIYRNINIIKELKHLPKLLRETTYFPEYQRKSKFIIFIDNLIWLIKNKEVNRFYYSYGMDRKDIDISEYLPYSLFADIRNMLNFYPISNAKYNFTCLLRDKLIFGQYLKSFGIPTPENIAMCDSKNILWLSDNRIETINQLFSSNINVFCKSLTGESGEGVFHCNC